MKKLVSTLLILMLLAGCFPCVIAESTALKIEYYFGHGGSLGELFLELIDEFNASQSAIEIVPVQFADYLSTKAAYQAALAAGNPPALMDSQRSWMLTFEPYLQPLNDWYANDADFNAEDILEGCRTAALGSDEKTYYGAPLYGTTSLAYYRKDAFEGYDPDEVFKNWQTLADFCRETTVKDEKGEGIFWGWEPMYGVESLTWSVFAAGGDVFTDDTQRAVNWTDDAWVDVCTNMKAMLHDEKIMRIHYGGTGWEYWYATIDDVMNGDAAGYCGSVGDQGDLDFSIIAAHRLPGWRDNTEGGTVSDVHFTVMSADISDEQKAAAWEFMKYMSSTESQCKLAMASGYIVTRQSCVENAEFAAFIETHPQVIAAMDALSCGIPNWSDPTGGLIYTVLQDLTDRIEIENMDVMESLTQAQEEAQAILDDFWANQEETAE